MLHQKDSSSTRTDTLVIWKLDRLARSLNQLIETVEALSARLWPTFAVRQAPWSRRACRSNSELYRLLC